MVQSFNSVYETDLAYVYGWLNGKIQWGYKRPKSPLYPPRSIKRIKTYSKIRLVIVCKNICAKIFKSIFNPNFDFSSVWNAPSCLLWRLSNSHFPPFSMFFSRQQYVALRTSAIAHVLVAFNKVLAKEGSSFNGLRLDIRMLVFGLCTITRNSKKVPC